jgi:preprotein translocase subunit SecG
MLLGILIGFQIVICVCLVGVVLLQRSEGGGLVGGSGGPSGMMSVRGAGDLMTRTTWILATAFFITSLVLTIISGREKGASSVVDRLKIGNVDPNSLNQNAATPPAGTAQPGSPTAPPTPLQAPTPQINNPFLGAPAPAEPVPTPAQK